MSSVNPILTDMSSWTTKSILIGIDAFNVVFQGLCCYLLITIYKRTQHKKTQELYLINLAIVETFTNVFLMVRDVMNLQRLQRDNSSAVYDTVFWCMNMFYVTGICYLYMLAMFYITGDLLCLILCSLKYKWYMSIKRTRRLVICTWMVTIHIGMGFCLWTYFKFNYIRKEAKVSKIMSVYVLPVFYVLYLIFAVISYLLIFLKYIVTERRLKNSHSASESCSQEQARRPRFTLCILLVTTYLLLTVLPSLTRAGLYFTNTKFPYAITLWYLISIRISYTVDGVLYVFIQKKVRRLLWKKVSSRRQQEAYAQRTRLELGHTSHYTCNTTLTIERVETAL